MHSNNFENTHNSSCVIKSSRQSDKPMRGNCLISALHDGREHGAIVIKGLDIATNFSDLYDQETLLMNAEFKLSLNAYLSDLLRSPVRSLADVIAFNNAHPVEVTN